MDASPVLPKAVKHVQRRFRKHRDDDDPPASDAARHTPRLVPCVGECRRHHCLMSEWHPDGCELQNALLMTASIEHRHKCICAGGPRIRVL